MNPSLPETAKEEPKSSLVKNGVWGVMASVLQVLFISLFFAIMARRYQPAVFGRFLVANTVYQIVASFSSMGLGQWFIRQYALERDKRFFTSKFLKLQAGMGLVFMLINVFIAMVLYQDEQIRILCVVLGTNIVFDNFINAIKTLNVAEGEQRKSAIVLMVDGFLRLLVSSVLFIYPLSIIWLSVLVIAVRLFTLGIMLKLGSSSNINLLSLWRAPVLLTDAKQLVLDNWRFVVIGSISIIYWRSGNIIISKMLTLAHVADYEVAFRFFSILQILPLVASSTIYPQFIKYFNSRNFTALKSFYKNIFVLYTLFAIITYVFVYAFSGQLIPIAFGNNYPGAVSCMQQMFLTILVLPTVLLQANLIVAMGLEKLDMWFNLISLTVHVTISIVGLLFIRELQVVNYAVFASFIVFHLLQDVFLIRKDMIEVKHAVLYYLIIALTVMSCLYGSTYVHPYWLFAFFFLLVVSCGIYFVLAQRRLQQAVK
jgi:O-antigen/teichoic acid export membrane protein